jgi:serine protease Do
MAGPETIQPNRPTQPGDLIRRPDRPGATTSFALGLELLTLNPQLALRYRLPSSVQGAIILGIDPESPLATICQPHDVIAKINDQAVESAEDAVKLINGRAEHDPLVVSLDRRGSDGIERYTIRVP